MQAAVTPEQSIAGTSGLSQTLFDRFWDDVAPLNNFSPEAAQALLVRETVTHERMLKGGSHQGFAADPWLAVRAALQERAAGRTISRSA